MTSHFFLVAESTYVHRADNFLLCKLQSFVNYHKTEGEEKSQFSGQRKKEILTISLELIGLENCGSFWAIWGLLSILLKLVVWLDLILSFFTKF